MTFIDKPNFAIAKTRHVYWKYDIIAEKFVSNFQAKNKGSCTNLPPLLAVLTFTYVHKNVRNGILTGLFDQSQQSQAKDLYEPLTISQKELSQREENPMLC